MVIPYLKGVFKSLKKKKWLIITAGQERFKLRMSPRKCERFQDTGANKIITNQNCDN